MPLYEAESDDHLESLIQEHQDLIIVFGSESCGPCKRAKPVYTELSEQSVVVYADFLELAETVSSMNIHKIPHFVKIHAGSETKRMQDSSETNIRAFFE